MAAAPEYIYRQVPLDIEEDPRSYEMYPLWYYRSEYYLFET